jgi:hypothetical protein
MKHRFPFGGISGSPVSQGCAVETKWVGKNGLSAAEILWDLMRLELIAHHEGADAFFVLAGRRKHLEAFFESRAFLGSPKADRSYRRLLKLDRGRNPRIRIDSPAADRLEIIRSLLPTIKISLLQRVSRLQSGFFFIMHAPVKRDILRDQADDAIKTACRLQSELSRTVAAAYAQCRRMEHWQTLQSGLSPAVAISLLVRARVGDQFVR